jgi:C-terminal processing protease CtpA/Prc
MLSNADKLASRFFEEKTLTGYIQHKTGTGHNDFSKPFAKQMEPSSHLRYKKPVVVLTNRRCYSATNDFVNSMRYAPNVTIMGDRTGGGGGLPFSSELPNGWSVRLSACPNFDASMKQIEFGIEPDKYLELDEKQALKGIDSMIDEARAFLMNESKSGKSFGK